MTTANKIIHTYQLKQQTPMIHFQYYEEGATLRATEVKPKLDRFIIKKLGGVENAKNIVPDWFIPDTNALNYKIRITAKGNPTRSHTIEDTIEAKRNPGNNRQNRNNETNKINGMYFGNMVSTDRNDTVDTVCEKIAKSFKETVFYKDPIDLQIICFNTSLGEKIKENIIEFFAVTNFGTRQSKGFGGFIVESVDEAKVSTDYLNLFKDNNYTFFYATITGNDIGYQSMLDRVQIIYSVMKGGFSQRSIDQNNHRMKNKDAYIKGYIMKKYLEERYEDLKIGSDKAFMKSFLWVNQYYEYTDLLHESEQRIDYRQYDDYFFVRALLGLAGDYSFKHNRKDTVYIYHLGHEKDGSMDIKRFKSPVTVKIIHDQIFFIIDDSYKKLLDQTFYFINERTNRNYKNCNSYSEKRRFLETNPYVKKIKTPSKFDAEEFFKGFVSYYNDEETKLDYFNAFYGKFKKYKGLKLKYPTKEVTTND